MKLAKEKEITDSFCEEDTQENVKGAKGAGESLSNYSVPFVNLSGLFGGKKSARAEERKEGSQSARSERPTVAMSSTQAHSMTSPHSQSVATGIGLAEPPIINPDVLQRTEKEKKDLEERLFYMESVLRELAAQNEQTRKEKTNIESEMERLILELKETKI